MGTTSEGGPPSDPVDEIVSESVARAPATAQGDGTSSSEEEEEDSSICANQDKDGDQKMGRVLTPKQKKKRKQKGKGGFISRRHKKPRKDKSTAVSADTGVHPPHRRPLLLLHPKGSHFLHQFLLMNQDKQPSGVDYYEDDEVLFPVNTWSLCAAQINFACTSRSASTLKICMKKQTPP